MNLPGILSAVLAGLLSFISPCVLPLIPAYLSFISGASVVELGSGKARPRVFARSLAFSAGFTLAFTILGIAFSGGAMFVGRGQASLYIGIAGGILVILLGLNLIFDFIKFLNIDARFIAKFSGKKTGGIPGAILLGFAFAAGWSPCIGPILGSILLFAGREGTIPRAALLLLSYSLGLALPFLATGLFFDRLKPLLAFLAKRGKEVRIVSGLVLIIFGIAMAAGSLGSVSALAARAGYRLEAMAEASPGAAQTIGAVLWASIGSVFAALFVRAARRATKNGVRLAASSFVAAALSFVGFALAVAEAAGAFSTLPLIAGWLTFTGF